jgi:hypothetical protein
VTVLLGFAGVDVSAVVGGQIDRSTAIVVEIAQNPDRANFPLKSKSEEI